MISPGRLQTHRYLASPAPQKAISASAVAPQARLSVIGRPIVLTISMPVPRARAAIASTSSRSTSIGRRLAPCSPWLQMMAPVSPMRLLWPSTTSTAWPSRAARWPTSVVQNRSSSTSVRFSTRMPNTITGTRSARASAHNAAGEARSSGRTVARMRSRTSRGTCIADERTRQAPSR